MGRGAKPKDLTGARYGMLTAIKDVGALRNARVWAFRCDCGKEVQRIGSRVAKAKGLQNCGCVNPAIRSENGKANKTHGWSQHKLYGVWRQMMRRCYQASCADYPNYGGRGITVCSDWRNVSSFCEWGVKSGYQDGLTIERLDVDGNYSPHNCAWIPNKDQARNRTNMRMITYKGETMFAADWARRLGMKQSTIGARIRYGWTDDRIIGEPVR
jgi:hypothetical protein